MRRRRLLLLAGVSALTLSGGCTALFRTPFEQAWQRHEFRSEIVPGTRFHHLVLYNQAAQRPVPRPLNVYLDGDGRAWLGRGRPALDPTTRNPLMIRLLALDPGPAIYLGRPCYGGLHTEATCHPWYWTHGRYAPEVVESLAAALRRVQERIGSGTLRLIGYSGGGTLAMLLAARLPRVEAVVTLAGNLDPDAWTALHGYTPLRGSLQPGPLRQEICQWHWSGADDREIPPWIIRRALQPGSQVHFEVLPGIDHRQGWESVWPKLLKRVAVGCRPKGQKNPRQGGDS